MDTVTGPSAEQIKTTLRWLISVFGAGIAGWFAAKGWFSVDQVLSVLNSPAFAGFIVTLISLVWSLIAHKKSNLILTVDSMPEVSGVITKPTEAGRALAANVPSSTVVPSGTTAAAQVAGAAMPQQRGL